MFKKKIMYMIMSWSLMIEKTTTQFSQQEKKTLGALFNYSTLVHCTVDCSVF